MPTRCVMRDGVGYGNEAERNGRLQSVSAKILALRGYKENGSEPDFEAAGSNFRSTIWVGIRQPNDASWPYKSRKNRMVIQNSFCLNMQYLTFFALIASSAAFLLGGGGGGCGCAPPPPPPPCGCGGGLSLPPLQLPQIQLPQLPQPCGGGCAPPPAPCGAPSGCGAAAPPPAYIPPPPPAPINAYPVGGK
ncbi:unnamed protein product [Nippostrongylus brasiliensis]|uniref:Uncharacterized protein n=1 Tax=Nippostrongylus brasiliensis TaxID=27835 RepID=A0A0N4Y1K0_NIPBR|nr:unnamed protein product [Nippostrongylus brasiliensis]